MMLDSEPFLSVEEGFPQRKNVKEWKERFYPSLASSYIHLGLISLYIMIGFFYIRAYADGQRCIAGEYLLCFSKHLLR
jgi:hypothetical protein